MLVELHAQKEGAEWMLGNIRRSLQARLEGRNEGGDIEVMRLVDEIAKRESQGRDPYGGNPWLV